MAKANTASPITNHSLATPRALAIGTPGTSPRWPTTAPARNHGHPGPTFLPNRPGERRVAAPIRVATAPTMTPITGGASPPPTASSSTDSPISTHPPEGRAANHTHQTATEPREPREPVEPRDVRSYATDWR